MRHILTVIILIAAAAIYYYKSKEEHIETAAEFVKSHPQQHIAQSPAKPRNPDIPEAAWQSYEDAKDAVYQRDYLRAERDLANAVKIKPDFTEAWYNLGATQTHIAIEIVNSSEQGAVEKFREAVNSKKTARSLMMDGKWFEYTGDQQTEVRYDVEQALEYADDVLNHEAALIDMLRAWHNQ
jgi:hypothetical protein